MTLYIKNKVLSLGGSTTVRDKEGNDLYFVKGAVFSPSKKKTIKDNSGKTRYVVKNRFFNFFSYCCYLYNGKGEKEMKITKKMFKGNKYYIEGYHSTLEIDGDFFGYDFSVKRDGVEIGKVSRDVAFLDAFVLDAEKKEDAPLLIALVIAIDNIKDNIKK